MSLKCVCAEPTLRWDSNLCSECGLDLREIGIYEAIGAEIGALVDRKNAAYGSSFAKAGDFLRLLWPAGVPPGREDDALLLVRIFDKQMRIATDRDAFGESPYRDIAGYGLLGAVLHQERGSKECGSASADAEEESKAQPASQPSSAAEPTTTSDDAPMPPSSSDACSPQPGEASPDVSAPSATASAESEEVGRLSGEQATCTWCGNAIDVRKFHCRFFLESAGHSLRSSTCSLSCSVRFFEALQ